MTSTHQPSSDDPFHRVLRDATHADHQRIDQALSMLDLADRTQYAAFLQIHRRALQTLAGRWRMDDQPECVQLLDHLDDDLRILGAASSSGTALHREVAESPDQWGVSYVIRGSRLGAAILRRRIPAQFPTGYLEFVPQQSWREFLVQLDARAARPEAHAPMIGGAKLAFAAFATITDRDRSP